MLCVSAGVGRTGTYIAVDTLMKQLREQYTVDVYGVVYKMRINRPYMVQTPVTNQPSQLLRIFSLHNGNITTKTRKKNSEKHKSRSSVEFGGKTFFA